MGRRRISLPGQYHNSSVGVRVKSRQATPMVATMAMRRPEGNHRWELFPKLLSLAARLLRMIR